PGLAVTGNAPVRRNRPNTEAANRMGCGAIPVSRRHLGALWGAQRESSSGPSKTVRATPTTVRTRKVGNFPMGRCHAAQYGSREGADMGRTEIHAALFFNDRCVDEIVTRRGRITIGGDHDATFVVEETPIPPGWTLFEVAPDGVW